MSIPGSTISRPNSAPRAATNAIAPRTERPTSASDGPTPATALADVSCWRLLTAQVPLTLLLDLALPSALELAAIYDELLVEPTSLDWVPARSS